MPKFPAYALLLVATPALLATAWYELAVYREPNKHADFLWEKRGRVVDASTGQGLASVTLVANWKTTYYSLKTSYNCPYQKVVKTDATGAYTLPDVSENVSVTDYLISRLVLGARMSFHWQLIPYKAGYMNEKDVIARGDAVAVSDYAVDWARREPQWTARDHHIEVNDLVLSKVSLPPEETLLYDAALLRAASCNPEALEVDPGFKALEGELADLALRTPCDLPKDEVLSGNLVAALSTLGDLAELGSRGEPLSPVHVARVSRFLQLIDRRESVSAGDVCKALSVESKEQEKEPKENSPSP